VLGLKNTAMRCCTLLPVSVLLIFSTSSVIMGRKDSGSESDAKRLYDDKLKKNGYNKLIRPVGNTSDALTVRIGLRLTQIIDVVNIHCLFVA